jgi:hypothetical protein
LYVPVDLGAATVTYFVKQELLTPRSEEFDPKKGYRLTRPVEDQRY